MEGKALLTEESFSGVYKIINITSLSCFHPYNPSYTLAYLCTRLYSCARQMRVCGNLSVQSAQVHSYVPAGGE